MDSAYALVVFLLNGKGRDSFGFPLYFKVTFNPTIIKNPKLMTQFWLDFKSADTVLQAMIKDHVRPSKIQSVYIPAEAGTILGPVLGTIPNRVDKIKALLIQIKEIVKRQLALPLDGPSTAPDPAPETPKK
ncbi:hypothetical protein MY11210_009723 [Beauveria gryllotalpidicola]